MSSQSHVLTPFGLTNCCLMKLLCSRRWRQSSPPTSASAWPRWRPTRWRPTSAPAPTTAPIGKCDGARVDWHYLAAAGAHPHLPRPRQRLMHDLALHACFPRHILIDGRRISSLHRHGRSMDGRQIEGRAKGRGAERGGCRVVASGRGATAASGVVVRCAPMGIPIRSPPRRVGPPHHSLQDHDGCALSEETGVHPSSRGGACGGVHCGTVQLHVCSSY